MKYLKFLTSSKHLLIDKKVCQYRVPVATMTSELYLAADLPMHIYAHMVLANCVSHFVRSSPLESREASEGVNIRTVRTYLYQVNSASVIAYIHLISLGRSINQN